MWNREKVFELRCKDIEMMRQIRSEQCPSGSETGDRASAEEQ